MSAIVSFLIAKAHANHSKSPSSQQINSMVTAERISEVEQILETTDYGELLEQNRPSVDLSQFEVAMRKKYADLLKIYKNSAKGDVARLLNAYTIKLEAENVDLILQAILRNSVDEELTQVITPVGKYGISHYERMMNTPDLNAATDFIIFPELKRVVQDVLAKTDDVDELSFQLSAGLSHASFSIIADVAYDWVKTEADFLNLQTIARAINLDIDPEPWLIPDIGRIYKHRNKLTHFNEVKEMLRAAIPLFPISRPLQGIIDTDNPIVELEDKAQQYIYYNRYRKFMIFSNKIDSILDFFSIKLAEIEDISRILLAKKRNISTDRVRELLYPIYRRN